MTAFEDFKLFYAKSLAQNSAADADLFIENSDGINLLYCNASEFTKRVVDTSNAQSEDKTSPDTGTAVNSVELRIAQDRSVAPSVNVLKTLLEMFYQKSSDTDFRKARFGLENTDNPSLDLTPTANGGYKLFSIKADPNPDFPAIVKYTIILHLVGDHTLLGAFQ